ncbi:MAG: hypothetical protein CMB80_02200 [Flammeovirgaceae bacterium]|nr:hypothetical protein [Flammeovirgaceae bacterium]
MKNLLGILANPQAALIKAIIKLLSKQFNLDALPKLFKYVDEDNELDIGLRKVRTEQEALKNMMVQMAKDSHEPQPYEERIKKLEEFQKKISNMAAFKKMVAKT